MLFIRMMLKDVSERLDLGIVPRTEHRNRDGRKASQKLVIREILLPFPAITVYFPAADHTLGGFYCFWSPPSLRQLQQASLETCHLEEAHIPSADAVPSPHLPPLLPYLPALATANIFFLSWCGCHTHKKIEVVYELHSASCHIYINYIWLYI